MTELDPLEALQGYRVPGPGERYLIVAPPPEAPWVAIPFGLAVVTALVIFMRGAYVPALIILAVGVLGVVLVGARAYRTFTSTAVELAFSAGGVAVTPYANLATPGELRFVPFADVAEVVEPTRARTPLLLRLRDGSKVELGNALLFVPERAGPVVARLRAAVAA